MKDSRRFSNQKGFTLVEMMVVLLIMSIILGATMWGVTGWISHFTYTKSEETARYIYLGTQSGLSAYQSRGTLDTLFDEIRKDTTNAQLIDEDKKALYGLPTAADLRDRTHEYACLKATGGLSSNPLLEKLAGPYVTDTTAVDGSIVVELDLTAKKVYSVFYSSWGQRCLAVWARRRKSKL